MARGDIDIFDKFCKDLINKDAKIDFLGGTVYDDKTGELIASFDMGKPIKLEQPDKSYENGPWIDHIRPKTGANGFEKCYVCPCCMTIGDVCFNGDICKFCGDKDKRRTVAKWVWDIWLIKGHWEPTNA